MFTTNNTDHLTRANIWSSQIKAVLEDELMGLKYVNVLSEFPDGDTFNIPSIGNFVADDYVEDSAVKYRAVDTGNFTFTFNEYKSSAYYITKKQMQDSFYMSMAQAEFAPKQVRAIMQSVETKVMGLSSKQTASDLNTINGAPHRFVGTGANATIGTKDFAKALYSLKKANVSDNNLVAIVDPSVEYALNTLTNLVDVSNNPRWEGIVESGIGSGMRFVKNIYGFDVYVSNYLADATETIDAATPTAGKANMFFSADSSILPFIGGFRQLPEVDSSFNKDRQREEYVITARYDFDLFHPENLVVVLTSSDQV